MKVALMWHGDREARDTANLDQHRLGPTAAAMRAEGLLPEAAVYNDDFADEVREQLLQVDAVQVWVNPIEQGRSREKLDAMLRQVASAGVLVSSHPQIIQKMGTKQVLYDTRHMEWGSDVHVYRNRAELQVGLTARLSEGQPRVLKQLRGHSGHGVWKVSPHPSDARLVLARHAARGSVEQTMPFSDLLALFEPYFEGEGRMIDQAYQERIKDGMIRCYLVRDRLAGFGHQAINALYPAPEGSEESQPGPRLYRPDTDPELQHIKRKMEDEWLPDLLTTLDISLDELPMLWDADLMFGQKDDRGEDKYVLCEINVSSVFPYPESAMQPLAREFKNRLMTGTPASS